MPLWDFQAADGEVREFLVPDDTLKITAAGKVYTRLPIQPFSFPHKQERSMGDEVIRGYRDQEDRLGSRLRLRTPAKEIKRAWSDELTT